MLASGVAFSHPERSEGPLQSDTNPAVRNTAGLLSEVTMKSWSEGGQGGLSKKMDLPIKHPFRILSFVPECLCGIYPRRARGGNVSGNQRNQSQNPYGTQHCHWIKHPQPEER